MPFPTYFTGTVSVADDGVIVTGTDTLWQRSNVREGDKIVIEPASGFAEITILSVENATHLTLAQPWTNGTKTNVPYVIVKGSIDRTVGRRSFDDMDAVVAALNAQGFFVFVGPAESEPDISIGDDGQYALQPSTGKLWVKEAGEWTFLGIYAALSIRGAYAADVTYSVNNVVTFNGKAYYAKRTTLGDAPDVSPDDWGVLVENGDRYDLLLFDTDRPASGEKISKFVLPTAVTFRAGLTESTAKADVAAAASAVFSIRKNGVQFATMTFALGATSATFVCASDTAFAAGDIFTIIAPDPRDATLAGVAATLVGYR